MPARSTRLFGILARAAPVGIILRRGPSKQVLLLKWHLRSDTLEPGQIITFKAMGNGTVITHRIIRRLDTPTLGGVFYQTKGDANRTADPDLAPAANVIGVVEGELPAWQDLAVSMQTPLGRLFVYGGLFVVIALGEIVDLIGASPRRGAEPDPTDEVTA